MGNSGKFIVYFLGFLDLGGHWEYPLSNFVQHIVQAYSWSITCYILFCIVCGRPPPQKKTCLTKCLIILICDDATYIWTREPLTIPTNRGEREGGPCGGGGETQENIRNWCIFLFHLRLFSFVQIHH